MSAAILTVQNVEKSFGARRVLAGASFAVHDRDRIGLVGVNGSGKSTLLRMVVGDAADPDETATGDARARSREDIAPDAGLITRRRELTLEYVPQEPKLRPDRTVGDVVREGLRAHQAALSELETLEASIATLASNRMDVALERQAVLHQKMLDLGGWDREHEIRTLASALELPPLDATVGALSIGERRRVALARALIARPELLALDEPTNHLDARTIEWLEGWLLRHEGALLLVTHDRYFLDRVATRILELDRGKLYAYEGNYRRFLEKQAERFDTESNHERERSQFVRRELEWIRRGPKARSTKQQARIDRFDNAVAAAPGAGDQRSGPMTLRLPVGGRMGKTILELRHVTRHAGDANGKLLFEDLSLVMKPGDRIGIIGPNGVGKTTLVRTILGHLQPDEGEVVVGQNTRFAFLDQGRSDLRDDRTVLQEVAGDADVVVLEDGPVHVRTFLRMMLFDDGFADTPVGTLSGGERNRVQLARLLRMGGNFLILDEPTNDLDLMTLGVLEEALCEFPGCALVVSHDRWFLDRVATAILAFEGDGRVVMHEGNHADYIARTGGAAAGSSGASVSKSAGGPSSSASVALGAGGSSVAATKNVSGKAGDKSAKMSFREQQELTGMEAAITAAEEKLASLEGEMADPEIYRSRAADVPGIVAALDAARTQVERMYARWQELEGRAKG